MAQDIINTPPIRVAVDEVNQDGMPVRVSRPFAAWFGQVFLACFSVTQSGTTAQRPTENLWVGRMYFDTSLGSNGKPIWLNKLGTGWVDASGASV